MKPIEIPPQGLDEDELCDVLIEDEYITIPRKKEGVGPVRLNRKAIYRLAAAGTSTTEICKIFDLQPHHFYKHFADDIERGRATIEPRLRAMVLKRAAVSDKILVFAAKNYLGMSEDPQPQATDEGGVEWVTKAPKKPSHKGLTADEKEELDAED